MKQMIIILSALLLSSCARSYRADYGVVVKVVRYETANEVTIRLYDNPYQVYGAVRDEFVFHTPLYARYAIGDTIHFVKQ